MLKTHFHIDQAYFFNIFFIFNLILYFLWAKAHLPEKSYFFFNEIKKGRRQIPISIANPILLFGIKFKKNPINIKISKIDVINNKIPNIIIGPDAEIASKNPNSLLFFLKNIIKNKELNIQIMIIGILNSII